MSDLTIIQGLWIGVPGVAVPSPTPTPTPSVNIPTPVFAGGAGANIHTPWEPLTYAGPVCGPEILDAFKKVCRNRKGFDGQDVLKVKRNIRGNEERVKKSELRALRKRLATLQKELDSKGPLGDELELAKARIRMLERHIDFLEQRLKRLESEAMADKKEPETIHVVQVVEKKEYVAVPPPRLLEAIRKFLPYAGASAISALATCYLVPDDADLLKFSGYALAIILANLGIYAALGEILGEKSGAIGPLQPDIE